MSATTSEALRANFRKLWPGVMEQLPNLQFVEQYDPSLDLDLDIASDFAFVADQVRDCGLSVDAATVSALLEEGGNEGALGTLRNHLAKGAKIGWWVVYNGDAERLDVGKDDDGDDEAGEEESPSAEAAADIIEQSGSENKTDSDKLAQVAEEDAELKYVGFEEQTNIPNPEVGVRHSEA